MEPRVFLPVCWRNESPVGHRPSLLLTYAVPFRLRAAAPHLQNSIRGPWSHQPAPNPPIRGIFRISACSRTGNKNNLHPKRAVEDKCLLVTVFPSSSVLESLLVTNLTPRMGSAGLSVPTSQPPPSLPAGELWAIPPIFLLLALQVKALWATVSASHAVEQRALCAFPPTAC